MRRLSILRHGKAQPDSSDGSDKSRLLAPLGERRSRAFGADLARLCLVPDQIISSDAARAEGTARLVYEGAGIERSLTMAPELYHEDPGDVLVVLEALALEEAQHVMMVGHNPTFAALAEALCAAGGGEAIGQYSPGTCAVFEVRAETWLGLKPCHFRLDRVFQPGDYGD